MKRQSFKNEGTLITGKAIAELQQLSIIFLYVSNEQVEFEIKNPTTPLILTPQKSAILDIDLTKYVYDLYEEHYETLIKISMS